MGKCFGDKSYNSKALSDLLFGNEIQQITTDNSYKKSKALFNEEKLLLRKRSVIKMINDEITIFTKVNKQDIAQLVANERYS